MSEDKIEIYRDEKLLELAARMNQLLAEELEMWTSSAGITSNGKRVEEWAKDMVAAYEETNEYLRNHYPNNTVADSWIGTNQFSAKLVQEQFLDPDPATPMGLWEKS